MENAVGLVAGTEIRTENGVKVVENLQVGDSVIAKGHVNDSAQEFELGSISEEVRRLKVQEPRIYGINGMSPFFAEGQVFHTTTGLRSLDPSTASQINPSATIGSMRVGHMLFRLDQNMKYGKVAIESIHCVIMRDIEVLYDVHLSTGRSYHANGFLTAVNYPDNSRKQPTEPRARPTPRGPPKLLEIERTFQFSRFEGDTSETLPQTLRVREGDITVDDDLLSQVSVDQRTRSITWTRPVASGHFEHGRVQLDENCMKGRGAVVYTEEAEPDRSNHAGLDKGMINFLVFPVA